MSNNNQEILEEAEERVLPTLEDVISLEMKTKKRNRKIKIGLGIISILTLIFYIFFK